MDLSIEQVAPYCQIIPILYAKDALVTLESYEARLSGMGYKIHEVREIQQKRKTTCDLNTFQFLKSRLVCLVAWSSI